MISIAGYACYVNAVVVVLCLNFVFIISTSYGSVHKVMDLLYLSLLCMGLAITSMGIYSV